MPRSRLLTLHTECSCSADSMAGSAQRSVLFSHSVFRKDPSTPLTRLAAVGSRRDVRLDPPLNPARSDSHRRTPVLRMGGSERLAVASPSVTASRAASAVRRCDRTAGTGRARSSRDGDRGFRRWDRADAGQSRASWVRHRSRRSLEGWDRSCPTGLRSDFRPRPRRAGRFSAGGGLGATVAISCSGGRAVAPVQ